MSEGTGKVLSTYQKTVTNLESKLLQPPAKQYKPATNRNASLHIQSLTKEHSPNDYEGTKEVG